MAINRLLSFREILGTMGRTTAGVGLFGHVILEWTCAKCDELIFVSGDSIEENEHVMHAAVIQHYLAVHSDPHG